MVYRYTFGKNYPKFFLDIYVDRVLSVQSLIILFSDKQSLQGRQALNILWNI